MNTLRKWINTHTKRKQEEGFWTKQPWVTKNRIKYRLHTSEADVQDEAICILTGNFQIEKQPNHREKAASH